MKYFKDNNDNIYAYEDNDDNIKDGLTRITKAQADAILTPPPPTAEEQKKMEEARIQREMDALISDMSTSEAMYLMLAYSKEKMSTDQNDEPAGEHLTPTGEDIIVWGDRLSSELETKITELRSL